MGKIYLTEYEEDGKVFAGPRIRADSFQEAQKIADLEGVTLLGELMFEIDDFSLN